MSDLRAAGEAIERLLQEKYAQYRDWPFDHLDGMVDGLDLAIGIINDHLPDDEPPIEGALVGTGPSSIYGMDEDAELIVTELGMDYWTAWETYL